LYSITWEEGAGGVKKRNSGKKKEEMRGEGKIQVLCPRKHRTKSLHLISTNRNIQDTIILVLTN